MTRNESRLLSALFWLCIVAAFSVFSFLAWERIGDAKESIVKYRTAIDSLPDETIDKDSILIDITTLKDKIDTRTSQQYLPAVEMAAIMKKNLSLYGVSVERLQTANNGKNESIDFLLASEPSRFFSFLRSTPTPGHGYKYSTLSVKSETESGNITVSMRLIHE